MHRIYGSNANLIKLPLVFFTELEQIISQFVWKYKTKQQQQKQITKAIWRRKNGAREINLPDFRLYYKASHKDSMVLAQRQKYRSMEQKRSPEINPHTYGHLIFNKGGKKKQWFKTISLTSGSVKTGQPLVKE